MAKPRSGWNVYIGVANTTITNGTDLDIEVFIPELAPNAVGEPDKEPVKTTVTVHNPITEEEGTGVVPRIQTILCQYIGGVNHIVPCVHVGERVWVFQYEGGEASYYWAPMGRTEDLGIRLREHARWFIMDQPKSIEGSKAKDVTDENSYFIDMNTNKGEKIFHIHTSTNDGEPYGYDLRIRPELNVTEFVDTAGNYFLLDSKEILWKLFNISGSYIELRKDVINVYAPKDINVEAGNNITVKAGKMIDVTAGALMNVKAPTYNNNSDNQNFTGKNNTTNMSMVSVTSQQLITNANTLGLCGAVTVTGTSFVAATAHGAVPNLPSGTW